MSNLSSVSSVTPADGAARSGPVTRPDSARADQARSDSPHVMPRSRERRDVAGALDGSLFGAIALAMASTLLWLAFQGWNVWAERQMLLQAEAGQQQQIDASNKVRSQLDAIASGMQKLADGGNANAKLVVDELRKRGVTINVPAAAGGK